MIRSFSIRQTTYCQVFPDIALNSSVTGREDCNCWGSEVIFAFKSLRILAMTENQFPIMTHKKRQPGPCSAVWPGIEFFRRGQSGDMNQAPCQLS